MVEKKNFIKCLLCFLFAVILPFSFIGCKSKTLPEGGGEMEAPSDKKTDNEANKDDFGGNDSEISGLSAEEVTELVFSKDTNGNYKYVAMCDKFIEQLNQNSALLEKSSYDSSIGSRTANALSYLKYPFEFLNNLNEKTLEFNKFYSCIENNNKIYSTFKVCVEGSEKIIIHALSNTYSQYKYSFGYFKFVLGVSNNQIVSLDVSKLSSGENIEFQETKFEFQNKKLTLSHGVISDVGDSAETFFKENFTLDKFSEIKDWGYRCFEELCFGDDNSAKKINCYLTGQAQEHLNTQFTSFGFLDAYDVKSVFENENLDKSVITGDIFAQVTTNGEKFVYNNSDYKFSKNS